MVGSTHLTLESLDHLVTLPGQAHFAIVDSKLTCRECEHWLNQKGMKDSKGLLKLAQCLKAHRDAPPIPHRAYACKHFTAAPNPPPA